MSDTEEQVVYLGVKIDEMRVRLDVLEKTMKQHAKVEESRLAAYENLDDKVDALAERQQEGFAAHGQRLAKELALEREAFKRQEARRKAGDARLERGLRNLDAQVSALAMLEKSLSVVEDPFAPDYEALAEQEPTSQYQASREGAGLA